MKQFCGTTIVSVRRGDQVAIGGDGQVSFGSIILKHSAKKIHRLFHGKVIAGFAGATADAFTLFEHFESKLEKYDGSLMRAAAELAKDWRTDKTLRRLNAMLGVVDHSMSLIITGSGDVLEPESSLIAIGCGGPYAHSAARALLENTDLSPEDIVKKSLSIAADLCLYTNHHQTIERL